MSTPSRMVVNSGAAPVAPRTALIKLPGMRGKEGLRGTFSRVPGVSIVVGFVLGVLAALGAGVAGARGRVSLSAAPRRDTPALPADAGPPEPPPRGNSTRSRLGAVLSMVGEVFGLIVQLVLIYIGIDFFFMEDDDLDVVVILAWSGLAGIYLLLTIIGLNILVRLDVPDPPAMRALIRHPLSRLLSTTLTFGASALGLWEAVTLIASIGHHEVDALVEVSAILTMLLSWAIFNWGFARIYYSRYHRAAEVPLWFPNSPVPRLTDFVYFAFTNATTFATSDVQVTSSRMRWTVVWHTSLAFFFNALIIALSMNVISRGDLFSTLLG